MLSKLHEFFNTSYIDNSEFKDSHIEADKLMLHLSALQWFIATFITSFIYDTYIYGFISGGLIFLAMFLAYKLHAGTRTMMIFSGMAMMLFSLVFIQQLYGRIEMHFHIFISMAILSVYKNIIPIIVATITTTLHHLIYNYLQFYNVKLFDMPLMVFNYGCGLDIVFLHALFVIIEAIILIYIVNIHVRRTIMLTSTQNELKDLNKELEYSSGHDILTGLPNRGNLITQMEYIVANAHRHQNKFAVVFLDLDYFKNINDTLGHDIGDKLLQELAKMLKSTIRENDLISRIGGDEFVLVIVDVENNANVINALKKILNLFKETIDIHNNHLRLSSSIGVSIYPDDSTNFMELMKYADIAMYKAKELGRNNFKFFTNTLDNELHEEVWLIQDMQEALQNNEFKLYYQPKVDVLSGKITGAEALLRWEHPIKGTIAPNIFIPLAENTGFILSLGTFVINEATRFIKDLKTLGYTDMNIAINVSARQFQHASLYDELHSALNNNNISGSNLSIEVTENVMMDDIGQTIKKLNMIKRLNIRVHMDDFGTGYSSLSYLQEFPIDTLKIDKSFIDNITKDGDNKKLILNTIIAMGHILQMEIVAEGVEELFQLEYLQDKKCTHYQGYYFSKAVEEDKLLELLKSV